VLTATDHNESAKNEALWQKWQVQMVHLSPKGIQFIAWGSQHTIQQHQPQLVIDAIATIIKMDKS